MLKRLCYNDNSLIRPLGHWKNPSTQIWPFMIESTSKILLCSNHNDQWAHYRNGRNIYPKIRAPTGGTVIGYPVKVSITPTGYKIIETNIRQLPNIYHQNKLQPTQNWAKLATGNITCYKARKLESMWKNGTDHSNG